MLQKNINMKSSQSANFEKFFTVIIVHNIFYATCYLCLEANRLSKVICSCLDSLNFLFKLCISPPYVTEIDDRKIIRTFYRTLRGTCNASKVVWGTIFLRSELVPQKCHSIYTTLFFKKHSHFRRFP